MQLIPWLGLALLLICSARSFAQETLVEPFTAADRWSHYLHRTYGPQRLGLLAIDSALDHAMREPACWDSTATSYGLRYGRSLGRRIIRNSAELGGGIITGEDLRYRPMLSGPLFRRVWHAARSSVTAYSASGGIRPAYTRFFATAAADASTVHWTGHPIRTRRLAESSAWALLDQTQTNLLDEFGPDMRRIGGRLWTRIRAIRP